jgi:riboflavin synthase
MKRTSLSSKKRGAIVNLERALRLSERLGGHIVTGHIDGTGTVVSLGKATRDWVLEVQCAKAILDGMCVKGSVACDGVSLTIAKVIPSGFCVHLIPLTVETTSLSAVSPGDVVNIETDALGKYVRTRAVESGTHRADHHAPETRDGITIEGLRKAGFPV